MTTFLYFTGPEPQAFTAPVASDGAVVHVFARRPNTNELNVNSQAPAGLAIPAELLPATWTLTCDDDWSEVGYELLNLGVEETRDAELKFHETHVGRLLASYLPQARRVTIIDAGSPRDSWTWRHLHSPSEFLAYVAQESEGYGPVNAVYSPLGAP